MDEWSPQSWEKFAKKMLPNVSNETVIIYSMYDIHIVYIYIYSFGNKKSKRDGLFKSFVFCQFLNMFFFLSCSFSPHNNGRTVFIISNFPSGKSVKADVNSQKDPEIVSPPGGLKNFLEFLCPKIWGETIHPIWWAYFKMDWNHQLL